ncbi:MAG: hypothetical protein KJ702_10340, partial [Gammaproteobacteria bacterium]|nr:hypothetical protein [Gammaproteobacteria bacterium]
AVNHAFRDAIGAVGNHAHRHPLTVGAHVPVAHVIDGGIGIPEGMIYGMPCTCAGGKWEVVKGLEIDAFSREKMDATLQELAEERDGVKHLFA